MFCCFAYEAKLERKRGGLSILFLRYGNVYHSHSSVLIIRSNHGGSGMTAGRRRDESKDDFGGGKGKRTDDYVCSVLEIHEIEKVGDLPKKRINQIYVSTSMSTWFSYLHMVVEAKELHRYVLNPLQTPTFLYKRLLFLY